jgi:hypothetical protein
MIDTRRNFLRFATRAAAASVACLSTEWAPAAWAVGLACTKAKPAVHVDVSVPPPVLDNSKPQRAIQALAPAYHAGRTVGLYSAEVEAKIQTRFRAFALGRERASPACFVITAVDIGVVMPTRRIYVASEFWPGTCQHTAVLEHERKHEAADDVALRKHLPRLQQAIQDAVAHLGPLEASSGERDAAQARLGRPVQAAFDQAWQDFQAERNELQRQVDAGLEYARVTASCSDWSQIPR